MSIQKNINHTNKEDLQKIVDSLFNTSSKTQNEIWETFCDSYEKSISILKLIDPFKLSELMYNPDFKYGTTLAEYLIQTNLKSLLANHALFVGYSNTTMPCDIIISNYLWKNLHHAIDLYTVTYDGVKDVGVANVESILNYMKKHQPFEKWLDTKPSVAKLKKTVQAYIEFQSSQESKDSILKTLIEHPHTAYISNNINTLKLLDINETSSNYWTLMFNKIKQPQVDSNPLEFITFQ